MNWSEWHYEAGARSHHRYPQGDPWTSSKTWSVVEKQADGSYAWAVYPSGRPASYGRSATLVAAKRDADRAEINLRLADANAALALAQGAVVEARTVRDRIKAELGPRRSRQ
jgi:hypothetical protein